MSEEYPRQTYVLYCQLSVSARRAAEGFRELNKLVAASRLLWLPTVGGEWPDRFVLLNRYVRTDVEPEHFTDGRVQIS